MTELERIARALCVADGGDPDLPAWSRYANYVKATLDATCVLNAIPLAHEPDLPPAAAWRLAGMTNPRPKGIPNAEDREES